MQLFDIPIDDMAVWQMVSFLFNNPAFNTISAICSMVSFLQEASERYREKKWRKTFAEAVLLCAALAALCMIVTIFQALFVVALVVLLWTFLRRVKSSRDIKANVCNKMDAQVKDMLADSMEDDYEPRLLDFSRSAFKNAEQCLKEKRPRAAIQYLNDCRGKERNQPRFVMRYADALIMLENYEGALAKLNTLSPKQIRKKKRYKKVMIKKAACYYWLNMYIEELDCCDKVIASNYKPEKYYYYRGKVKTRLLEIYPYVDAAGEVIFQTYGSLQSFAGSALADLDKALSYGDEYKAEILSYKGSCCFHLQEQQKALDFLCESQRLNETFANNYVYFGIYYYEKEDFAAAEAYLEKGIAYGTAEACPEKEIAYGAEVPHLYLARISYKGKEYDKAILHAAKALSVFPHIDECYGIQGDCYEKKKMYTEAITCYTQAIGLKRKADYFQSRAVCYYNKTPSEYRKAYEDALEAVKLDDSEYNRIETILYNAAMDRDNGQRKGLDELELLLQPYAGKPKYFVKVGLIYDNYEYWDMAAEYYAKEIEYNEKNNRDSSVAHYDLALVLSKQGRLEEAIDHLEAAIASDPMSMKYLTKLEKCYRDSGDTGKEIETQLRIRSLKQKYLTINKRNGDSVYRLGKYYSAEKYYRSALKYVPYDPAVLNNLACALYCQEKYKEAIECLDKVMAQKGNYLAYFNLGNCCLRTARTKKEQNQALLYFQTAKKLSAGFEPAEQMLQSPDPSNIMMMIDGED